jgi:hypothetical protein
LRPRTRASARSGIAQHGLPSHEVFGLPIDPVPRRRHSSALDGSTGVQVIGCRSYCSGGRRRASRSETFIFESSCATSVQAWTPSRSPFLRNHTSPPRLSWLLSWSSVLLGPVDADGENLGSQGEIIGIPNWQFSMGAANASLALAFDRPVRPFRPPGLRASC